MSAHRLAWLVVGLSACSFDFDAVGPRGDGGQGGGAGGDSNVGGSGAGGEPMGGFVACDRCVDLTGFSAPFAVPGTCEAPTLRAGNANVEPVFTAAAAECGCACVPPDILGCATPSLSFYDEAQCSGSITPPQPLPEGECIVTPIAASYSLIVPSVTTNATAACVTDGEPSTAPPVVFTDPVLGCDAGLPDCAASATCIPADSAGLCVVGEVELACPEGFEQAGFVLLEEELFDDRSCECVCGALSATCSPTFALYRDNTCDMPMASAFTNQCQRSATSERFDGIVYRPTALNPSCSGGKAPSGEVVPGPLHQLCCM